MFGSNRVNWNNNKKMEYCNDVIEAINMNNFTEVKRLVESKNLTERELNDIQTDSHKNTFLHLAVINNNMYMTTYFLEKGIKYDKQNKLGQSPWDIALAFRYSTIIEKIINYRIKTENLSTNQVSQLTLKLDQLESKNKELKKLNNTYEIHSRMLKSELSESNVRYNLRNRDITLLTTENTELKLSNKRLRDTNNNLITENTELKESNKKLKISVETLMENTQK